MFSSTFFIQECPTCGRSLQVRVQYLGKTLRCRHCQGDFKACDPSSAGYPPEHSGLDMLRRANQLLESVEKRGMDLDQYARWDSTHRRGAARPDRSFP